MRTRRVFRYRVLRVAASCLAALAASGAAEGQDWGEIGATDVVVVVTRNPDGSDRDTKVWIVVVDDRAYHNCMTRNSHLRPPELPGAAGQVRVAQ